MAKKIKLTRPELKRHREALQRYERYLPMLKLKQQRLQAMVRNVIRKRLEAEHNLEEIQKTLREYESVQADRSGLPLKAWSNPTDILVDEKNVAGVLVPVFSDVTFPEASYSLFGTPPWVDELTRIIQRVNLFEKVMIPEARESIRRIRIKLGDEMTDAVGRSKIAKNKLARTLNTAPDIAKTIASGPGVSNGDDLYGEEKL